LLKRVLDNRPADVMIFPFSFRPRLRESAPRQRGTDFQETGSMPKKVISGAERLVRCVEEEGVNLVFGLPGGAAIPFFDALVGSKIRLIQVRHEQGATHMADGYARATGKPGVVAVTSGPGATNTVTGLLTALMDSSPVVVLTGQTNKALLGKDAFQEADVTGITYPLVKHSYLITEVNEIPRVVKEAFYLAASGRPGPVLVDLPKDVASAPCTAPPAGEVRIPGYSVPTHADRAALQEAAKRLNSSRRPLLLLGQGAVIARARKAVTALAEKLRCPVVTTLLGKGAMDESHRLHLGMLGMHGTAYANKAVMECDLIMSIGSRWDDRITSKLDEFCSDAVRIHIDIDPSEFDKTVKCHVHLLGDARVVVEDMIPLVKRLDTREWVSRCNGWRKSYPLKYVKNGKLRTAQIVDHLDKFTKGKAIIVTDVGQHQMWTAQFIRVRSSRMWLSSGGAGTMGFGMPAAIGAQLGCPDKQVWAVVGDGGFQMTQSDLATAAIHKLPIKVIINNNRYLGMVRQWQQMFFENRLSGVALKGSPDFVKLAEAYGVKGLRIEKPGEIDRVLKEAADYGGGPCLIDARVEQEDNVFPMIPAGAPISGMLIDRPVPKKRK
jgi:acetolactate synthase-1/2/3 large subunit